MDQTVLVVDDDFVVRDLLEQFFSQAGYPVRIAENAEDALKVLSEDNIQVIFSDMDMPGMNGLELCRQIRHNQPMAIIHAMTGCPSLFELNDCREAGFDDYFIKPLQLQDIVQAAQVAFEKLSRWKKRQGARL
ncbi:MAG: response regulator [Desulfohalobiaceae bacterium]